jgi:hypothetical protein
VTEYCIENNILKKYLQEYGSEVINMIFGDGEYDRDIDIAVNRREAREEAFEEIFKLLNQGLTTDEIKERLNQEEDN